MDLDEDYHYFLVPGVFNDILTATLANRRDKMVEYLDVYIPLNLRKEYIPYYKGEKIAPIDVVKKLTKIINRCAHNLPLLLLQRIYTKFTRTHVKKSTNFMKFSRLYNEGRIKREKMLEFLNTLYNVDIKVSQVTKEELDSKEEMIEKYTKMVKDMTVRLKNEERLSQEVKVTLEKTTRDLENLRTAEECLQMEKEGLTRQLEFEREIFVETLEELEKEDMMEEECLKAKLDEWEKSKKKICQLLTEKKKMESKFEELLGRVRNLNFQEPELQEKVLKKHMRRKKYLEVMDYLKKSGLKRGVRCQKFFNFTISESLKKKLEKGTGLEFSEFEPLFWIDHKVSTDKKINKILLKLLKIVQKGTSSKVTIWFRNSIQTIKLKSAKTVHDKFYYTFMCPFDTEIVSKEEFDQLTSKQRRRLFLEKYQEFDQECNKMVSLYDDDTANIRTRFEETEGLEEEILRRKKEAKEKKREIMNAGLNNFEVKF